MRQTLPLLDLALRLPVGSPSFAIARLTGFTGEIRWDTTKPDGHPRRRLDTSRARERFGFVAETDFEAGLRQTTDWFTEYRPDRSRWQVLPPG